MLYSGVPCDMLCDERRGDDDDDDALCTSLPKGRMDRD